MSTKTRQVKAGNVLIGGGAPVSVQSMTNTDTADVEATLSQIRALTVAGADIVRVSVYNEACAEAVRAPGETVVFWHTGGATALFAEQAILGDLAKK